MPFNLNNALGSLGALGQGYFSGQDAATERAMRLYQIQRQKDENQRIDADRAGMEDATAKLAQQLGPPPQQTPPPVAQAPSPGQSSQAMRPQQAPPQGLQLPPQFQVPGMQPPPQQGQMGPNPGLGAPGGQRPPMPPWTGYQSPQVQQQQGMPQGVPQPPPQSSQQQVPQQGYDLPTMVKTLVSQGVPAHYAFQVVQDRFVPMLSFEGKMQLQQAQQLLKQRQLENKDAEFNARESRLRAQFGLDENGNPTMAPGTRSAVNAATVGLDAARANKLAGKFNLGGAGSDGSKGSGTGGTGLQEDALDLSAWKYGINGALPYRKGKGGPSDPNTAIQNRWSQIAKDLGYKPEELAAMPAEFKSDAQSLYFQQKKADAIQAQLNSFHNNMKTWDELARGVAPTIGGAQTQALAGKLQAMNFTDIKSLNEMKLRIQQEFNDPSTAAYVIGAMAVAMDYARIQTGPQSAAQLTEGARKDAMSLLSAGLSNQARAAALGALDSDATGQVKGQTDQLNAIKARMTGHGKVGETKTAASSKDQAAIAWAKSNPNDPRAKKILELHPEAK